MGADNSVTRGGAPTVAVEVPSAQLAGAGVHAIADFASILDASTAEFWVIGADRERGASVPAIDPSLVATVVARNSTSIGLVVAAAAHRDHPYNLARRLVSVDHAAGGRIGWLALHGDQTTALRAPRDDDAGVDPVTHSPWSGRRLDAQHTADAITAVRTLWRTWPFDSVLGDRENGAFTDSSRVRRGQISGTFDIDGALNLPGSVQGDLPILVSAPSGDLAGITSAPSGADLVVIDEPDLYRVPESGPLSKDLVVRVTAGADLRDRLSVIARRPDVASVLLSLSVITATRILGGPVAELIGTGQLRARREGGSLRERLQLEPTTGPDLAGSPRVFASVAVAGGRVV